MAGIIGTIEHFSGKAEEFEIYVERLEHLFKVNVVTEDMKLSMFITLVGPEVYMTLRNLLAPRRPEEKSYQEVIAILRKHYSPVKSEISERFTFNKCNQKSNQTVSEYIVELRKLANSCNFGNFLDEALRDRLVCGLAAETLQKKLLAEIDLTFTKACSISQAYEMADKQVKLLGGSSANDQIHSVKWAAKKQNLNSKTKSTTRQECSQSNQPQRSNQSYQKQQAKPSSCYRCGRWHNPVTCPAKDWECFVCKKKGHTSKMCRNKKVGAVQDEMEKEEQQVDKLDLYPLNKIEDSSISSYNVPHKLSLGIEGKLVAFEVDTGACKTVVPFNWFKENFPDMKLNIVNYNLVSVTGQPIKAAGEVIVKVHYEKKQHFLPLTVVISENKFTALMGRNWLNVICPGWQKSFKLGSVSETDYVGKLKAKFNVVFDSDLSCPIKNFEVNLRLKENVEPIFKKAYSMPYALKSRVEEKLKMLERSGIIKPVSVSKWASPIVVVPKKMGTCESVWISGAQ